MATAVFRVVEEATEHIHAEFQNAFGFSMTIDELTLLQRMLVKHLTDCVVAAGKEPPSGDSTP